MMRRRHEPEAQNDELSLRVDGLEYAIDESVPALVGMLVFHLAKNNVIDLGSFESELRKSFNPEPNLEDSTGASIAKLADLVSFFRKEFSPVDGPGSKNGSQPLP